MIIKSHCRLSRSVDNLATTTPELLVEHSLWQLPQ